MITPSQNQYTISPLYLWIQTLRIRSSGCTTPLNGYKRFEHPWILVSVEGPGTNPPETKEGLDLLSNACWLIKHCPSSFYTTKHDPKSQQQNKSINLACHGPNCYTKRNNKIYYLYFSELKGNSIYSIKNKKRKEKNLKDIQYLIFHTSKIPFLFFSSLSVNPLII